jgi:hypothetical protein
VPPQSLRLPLVLGLERGGGLPAAPGHDGWDNFPQYYSY